MKTKQEAIDYLNEVLSSQAYERGHSAGEDEVNAILNSLKSDLEQLYVFLEGLD